MRRDALLLAEIVNAVERILELAAGVSAAEIEVAPRSPRFAPLELHGAW